MKFEAVSNWQDQPNPFDAVEFAENDTYPHGTTEGICLPCEYGDQEGSVIGSLMDCYQCCPGKEFHSISRKVVKLGPVTEQRRDPTQTYVLDCGHTVI